MTPFAVGGPYQVEVVYYYPNLGSPYYDGGGVATIGPGVEFPYVNGGSFSVNLRLRKLIITFQFSVSWTNDVAFNGPVFNSLTSGANLPQPAYFISSPVDTSLMTLTSTATAIFLDWQGLDFNYGDVIVIGW